METTMNLTKLKRFAVSLCSIVSLAGATRCTQADDPLKDQLNFPGKLSAGQFAQYQALIKPAAHESPWAKISWHASVWEARKQAAAEGKPILIWSGGGSPPLGAC